VETREDLGFFFGDRFAELGSPANGRASGIFVPALAPLETREDLGDFFGDRFAELGSTKVARRPPGDLISDRLGRLLPLTDRLEPSGDLMDPSIEECNDAVLGLLVLLPDTDTRLECRLGDLDTETRIPSPST
jgi:hypothetical protein